MAHCARPPERSAALHATGQQQTTLVWDFGVRLFHWTLVAAIAAAAATGFLAGPSLLAWHLAAGTIAAAAIAWRLVWGGLGSTHARFADFLPTPSAVRAHLQGLRTTGPGHNPLGSLMVFAFLALIPVIAAAGTIALGGMFKQGPLHALSYAAGRRSLGLHEMLAIILLGMIVLHLAGVAFESRRERQNLAAAMLHGRKAAMGAQASRPGRPLAAIAATLVVLAAVAAVMLALIAQPRHDFPPAPPAVVAEQCGACHLAYPPNLAPAATWNAILDDLQHHFGEDATLSPDQIAAIRSYYDANDATRSDTLPAHMLRMPAADGSLRITDTRGWRRRHRHIPDAIFVRQPIYRRGNCAACHKDAATGAFAPQSIAPPG